MATLLTMLNDLFGLLSEEPITSISATDARTQAMIVLLNKATTVVLESRVWSFDKRTDGEAAIGGTVSGATVTHLSARVMVTESGTGASAALFDPGNMAVRFRVTDDTVRPSLSYKVVSVNTVGVLYIVTLATDWVGEQSLLTASRTWTVYTTDFILPSTVRKVLSVRDEEQPLQLYFTEDEIFTDRYSPRPLDDTGEVSCVIVGGTETSSFEVGTSTALTGMRMRVLPVPEDDTMLYYSYVYRHPAMTSATDTLVAVPDNVIRLIVDKAFYYCLSSNIESDIVKARRVEKQYRIDWLAAEKEDIEAPNRRRVLNPSGTLFTRHPNSRWESRQVPLP
jgi:hypothetical protein